MLQMTMKQSKFYRTLKSGESDDLETEDSSSINQEGESDDSGNNHVQKYRKILNDFFRMIVKLNSCTDLMS